MSVYTGILRAAGLAKEVTPGTLVTPPTAYVPYIPPDGFSPDIAVLESKAIYTKPDAVYKATQGPGTIKGKVKVELEPENCGDIIMGAFGVDTLTGPADVAAYTHSFTRLAAALLPTYSWWFDRGAGFAQFLGCMVSKLDIEAKAKEFVTLTADYIGLSYDSSGTSKAPTYSALHPFRFHQVTVNVDSAPVLGYDNLKVSIDNKVKAEHALNGTSIYTTKIWSEGMRVTISADLYFEDLTQYNKFLAGTTAAFNIVMTSDQLVPGAGTTKCSLTLDIPQVQYTAAPLYGPTGVIKVPFAGVAVYNVAAGYSIKATLVNSKAVAY